MSFRYDDGCRGCQVPLVASGTSLLTFLVFQGWSMSNQSQNPASSRPPANTVALLERIVSTCRGTIDGMEMMRNVHACLSWLHDQPDQYLVVPNTESNYQKDAMASQTSPDDHLQHVPGLVDDGCPGGIVRYHTYWMGKTTWRVELFNKAFLFTQNIRCSRLTVWIDESGNPGAVAQSLSDGNLAKFESVQISGLLRVKPWIFPTRIPLPDGLDHNDGYGYGDNMERRGKYADSQVIADSVQRDPMGQVWLRLDLWGHIDCQSAAARSDIFRFMVLHIHGGLYLDMDMVLLRDMRPLLIAKRDFAERWGALSEPGDYNTAVLALQANSSLSSYLLRAGTRQGLFFHPRAIGRYMWKDGREQELLRLESALFDPVWPSFATMQQGTCAPPCFTNFRQFFERQFGPRSRTWAALLGARSSSSEADSRLRDFYAGAYTYHVHNQVSIDKVPIHHVAV